MKFSDIKHKIKNNPGFKSLKEIREAGYRIVKERDGDRYFLARQEELRPFIEKMSDYFTGERYLNTGGADGFFIVTDVGHRKNGFSKIQNDAITDAKEKAFSGEVETKYLVPIIKDYTKTIKRIEIDGFDAYCFVINDCPAVIKFKKRVMSNKARSCVEDELEVYIDKLVEDIYRQLFKPSRDYLDYRVHNLIVAMDEWYYFEEKIKPIIEDKLNGKRKGDGISEFKFHLLGCTDFEILFQYKRMQERYNGKCQNK